MTSPKGIYRDILYSFELVLHAAKHGLKQVRACTNLLLAREGNVRSRNSIAPNKIQDPRVLIRRAAEGLHWLPHQLVQTAATLLPHLDMSAAAHLAALVHVVEEILNYKCCALLRCT